MAIAATSAPAPFSTAAASFEEELALELAAALLALPLLAVVLAVFVPDSLDVAESVTVVLGLEKLLWMLAVMPVADVGEVVALASVMVIVTVCWEESVDVTVVVDWAVATDSAAGRSSMKERMVV